MLNDPNGSTSRLLSDRFSGKGKFYLCLGSTHTSDIPGISAAGITPGMRRLTPCTDAEALVLGRTVTVESIPVSPAGIVSPVVITRACLNLLSSQIAVADCGTFFPPAIPCLMTAQPVAQCLSTGAALPLLCVERLFEKGRVEGELASRGNDYLVLSECVPGGTTTAMGVLTALGFRVDKLLSSSLPECNHQQRSTLVAEGLKQANLTQNAVSANPLRAVAAVGDPMQPFVAGMAVGAMERCPVMLAGGSQMLAVFALVRAMLGTNSTRISGAPPVVATTKWVAFDPLSRHANAQ